MHRILIVLLLSASCLSGQSFFPLPGAMLTQEVALQQADECYIFFDNPSGDTLRLRWRKLEVSMPPGWDIDLCDYGLCYGGIPNNGTMNPVYDTIQPYLKLIVQPDTFPGAAWIWFRVYDVQDDGNFQDVYFNLYTQGVSSTTIFAADAAIRIFPNPASDWLTLENNGAGALPVAITDSNGTPYAQSTIQSGSTESIPVAAWPAGVYWIRTGRVAKKLIIQH